MRYRPPWFYRQAAVIPYRCDVLSVEVLLITSQRKQRWIFPKGVVEPWESASRSAAREAYEEAGIRGVVDPVQLGTYTYEKWGGTCTVEVFPLLVQEVLDDWPESSFRQRHWFSMSDAINMIKPQELRTILDSLLAQLRL